MKRTLERPAVPAAETGPETSSRVDSSPIDAGSFDPDRVDPAALPFAEYEHRKWWFRKRLPWNLWKYMALEIFRVMILGVLTVSLLYSAVAAYQLVRNGIQLTFIWPFLAKTMFYPLYFSIPLALLFGVTLAVGRMVAEIEISAMRCHGASYGQILFPILVLGALAAAGGYYLNGWVVPGIHHEKRNLQQYILKQLENLGSGKNRTILLPGGGGSLLVGAYQGTDLWKVEIDLNRKLQSRFVPEIRDQLPQRLPEKVTLVAKTGRLEIAENQRGLLIHLRGVEILVPETAGADGHFYQRFSITDTLSIPVSFEKREPGLKDLINPELARHVQSLEDRLAKKPQDEGVRRELAGAVSEKHRRLTFTFSSLTFPLIGACLCFLLERRNRLVPFFIGNVVVITLYYPLFIVGSYLGERGFLPWLSVALPNLALLALGGVLLRKVIRR